MTVEDFIDIAQWFFLLYFSGLHLGYMILNIVAFVAIWRYMPRRVLEDLPQQYAGSEPPISIIVPAYNEEAGIAASVRSLLQLTYSEYEVIVVNDGSTDATLDILKQEFSLYQFPEDHPTPLDTKQVRSVYRSRTFPHVKVLDKVNGGKADALNAGINCSRYPLFCSVDGDSVLQRDSLQRVVLPFMEDPTTVAGGGMVRICNGSSISGGVPTSIGLPRKILVRIQIAEYLRAFLFGRLGWSPLNSMLIISGAFGVFRKEAVINVGGYLTHTIGEDMELVVRLHRHFRILRIPYRITFVPDPVCWTEAPEDLKTLRNQRVRWQRGLSETLSRHKRLLFNAKGGTVSWLAFPFAILFEWLGPILEISGYLFMMGGFLLGLISWQATIAFLLLAIGLSVLISLNALLLEEISFHFYPRIRQIFSLCSAIIWENFGYRQLNALWRLRGMIQFALGRKARWGEMKRKGFAGT